MLGGGKENGLSCPLRVVWAAVVGSRVRLDVGDVRLFLCSTSSGEQGSVTLREGDALVVGFF